MKKRIVVAGGTGLIGTALSDFWRNKGHEVRILTRGVTDLSTKKFQWDPQLKKIDLRVFDGCDVLVNLCGEGIAEKRWTKKRKQALYDSRIKTTQFLSEVAPSTLQHYISASGISCYGFDKGKKSHPETDLFGLDDTSQLVQAWEHAADTFSSQCTVTKVRVGICLTNKGGALPKLTQPIRYGLGSPIGTGKQWIPWIHIDDLIGIFDHVLQQQLEGVYNACANNASNAELTKAVAKTLKKPYFLPPIPSFIIRLMFGKMADLLLKGARADNAKIKATGFQFIYPELAKALEQLFHKE